MELRKICQHCHENYVNRPRGLCWTCYYTPGVKDLYPPPSKYCVMGLGLTEPKNKPIPTTAMPGTAEKVAVLCQRAERGEALWHPRDAGGKDW